MGTKKGLGIDVLEAARRRISYVFDNFTKVCVSFSGGKDSSVMLHLVATEARRRKRRFALLFIDLEAQYKLTISYVEQMYREHDDCADPYWVALPMALRNAVSVFEPKWECWSPEAKHKWVRQPPTVAITDPDKWKFFYAGMEFEDFVEEFADWYSQGELMACLVGIRADESLNRYRCVTSKSSNFEGCKWTTWKSRTAFNAYPIYDWRTRDIWIYNKKFDAPYNALYDRMFQAGLTIHQARICQPYGDDQRKGLWLYQIIEPETWTRVVARVNGANSGALYSQQSGNITGVRKITKPEGRTWEEYAKLLLATMPEATKEHFTNKIAVFLKWYTDRGYERGIPDDGPMGDKSKPSWARICKALLRNDYWCKGLSFTQHKSTAYDNYRKLMKKRRAVWKLI